MRITPTTLNGFGIGHQWLNETRSDQRRQYLVARPPTRGDNHFSMSSGLRVQGRRFLDAVVDLSIFVLAGKS